jgi:ribonuclease Z
MIRAMIIFLATACHPFATFAQDLRVTLLGTGCPTPVMERFGPSTLVEAAGQKFIIDAGRGAMQRLRQLGVRWQDIDAVFITHLHSDHILGFPDLWLTGWVVGERRDRALSVFGPAGTKDMISHLEQAFKFDVRIRVEDDGCKPEGAVIVARDIEEGVVYEKGGVKVTAFEVDHAPIKPAFGYRVDVGDRSVVLSGDTRFSENLIRHAQGADLLIHEVVVPDSMRLPGYVPDRIARIAAHHTTPEEAGKVFSRVNPKLAVYSHIVMPQVPAEILIELTRKTYSGPLEVGEDLMALEVGDRIAVRRPDRAKP